MPRSLSTRLPDIGATAVAEGRMQPNAMLAEKRRAIVAAGRAERRNAKHVGNVMPSGVVRGGTVVVLMVVLWTDEREELAHDALG